MVFFKRRVSITFILLILILLSTILLTSCSGKDLTGKVIGSQNIDLKCSGEAMAILTDNCYDFSTRTLKLLIRNGDLADLKHTNIDLFGLKGTTSERFGLNIEMGETKLIYAVWPESLGEPESAKIQIYYFGNTGLENCVPYTLDMAFVRECGKAEKLENPVEETY